MKHLKQKSNQHFMLLFIILGYFLTSLMHLETTVEAIGRLGRSQILILQSFLGVPVCRIYPIINSAINFLCQVLRVQIQRVW